MQVISVSQMVRALNSSPIGLASWEKDAVQRCHRDSCHGLKPYLLSLRQVELINSIFHRIYQCVN